MTLIGYIIGLVLYMILICIVAVGYYYIFHLEPAESIGFSVVSLWLLPYIKDFFKNK